MMREWRALCPGSTDRCASTKGPWLLSAVHEVRPPWSRMWGEVGYDSGRRRDARARGGRAPPPIATSRLMADVRAEPLVKLLGCSCPRPRRQGRRCKQWTFLSCLRPWPSSSVGDVSACCSNLAVFDKPADARRCVSSCRADGVDEYSPQPLAVLAPENNLAHLEIFK